MISEGTPPTSSLEVGTTAITPMLDVEFAEETKPLKDSISKKGKGRGRAVKITPRNTRTPLAEINTSSFEAKTREKRKFNLLDETKNFSLEQDLALKNNLGRKQIKTDHNEAIKCWVMEATPEKPPIIQ